MEHEVHVQGSALESLNHCLHVHGEDLRFRFGLATRSSRSEVPLEVVVSCARGTYHKYV